MVIIVTVGFFSLLGSLFAPAPSRAKITPISALVKATPTPSLPVTVSLDVPNHEQAHNLSCEFQSASDLAAYYDIQFTWQQLFDIVGIDLTGNPNQGFVGGSLDDPPGSIYPLGYGVYPPPLVAGLQVLGVPAQAHSGQTVTWLKESVAAGQPVMVWATSKLRESELVEWETTDGVLVQGVRFEHTFTVVGYDDAGVWLNDPFTATTVHYDWAIFERSWALLGNMALTIEAQVPGKNSVLSGSSFAHYRILSN